MLIIGFDHSQVSVFNYQSTLCHFNPVSDKMKSGDRASEVRKMSLYDDMIKKVYKKIEGSGSNFCATPAADPKTLSKRIARTITGKESSDDLHLILVDKGGKKN